eukprot:CAMPEP_0178704684 /NCGR_PEP_ID=MMETSP0699-20121125/14343_1 /TAXON_ID=265572 /ORGANISM="Extubocellulus spinifer, Strain CCMP396" /LENGTH=159 /DNA_ID=CAMNT_0020352111 /DNA_START=497 /DNA_END=973 /DNA_ORIENTATION=-
MAAPQILPTASKHALDSSGKGRSPPPYRCMWTDVDWSREIHPVVKSCRWPLPPYPPPPAAASSMAMYNLPPAIPLASSLTIPNVLATISHAATLSRMVPTGFDWTWYSIFVEPIRAINGADAESDRLRRTTIFVSFTDSIIIGLILAASSPCLSNNRTD